jgi:hypothetical protein
MQGKNRSSTPRTSVVIVGGGIAGLYTAYLLGRVGHDVQLFELSNRWGGRIDSRRFELDDSHEFIAEFGPMRFEAHLQARLRRLCFHLGIGFESFSPTGAPIGTTHYDLTEIEESFKSVAALLQWAVLRMFFEDDIEGELSKIKDEGGKEVGPRQLNALKRYMDGTYFCYVSEVDGENRVLALPDETIQSKLEELRKSAKLRGVTPLRELGLWNALSEIITPGALARIRDNGTFYHFIAQNPSAVDWGIFWLRQASVMGGLSHFTRATAPLGTQSLVEKLVDRIRADCPSVHLSLGHEVVRVEHGKRPEEVVLRIACHEEARDSYSFSQRADHVILALPQQPLLKLAEHFPTNVRTELERVVAMPLLKAFLVTKKPWWRHHLKAQAYAWLVPTRELHFFRLSSSRCPSLRESRETCDCEQQLAPELQDTGMIMLYTDQPAMRYWQVLMTPAQQCRTTWKTFGIGGSALDEVERKPDGVLAFLIRRLMMIPDPGLARRILLERARFMTALKAQDPALATRIAAGLSKRVVDASSALDLAEQIVSNTADRASQEHVRRALEKVRIIDIDDSDSGSDWRDSLDLTIRSANTKLHLQDETARHASDVLAYGIRDWSAEPFGGAAHVWLPLEQTSKSPADTETGTPTQPPPDPLTAFSLRGRGRADSDYPKNVHICGEAYSSFQGFIEGALRTAEEVVAAIVNGDAASWVFSTDRDLQVREGEWVDEQTVELTNAWNDLDDRSSRH